MRFSLQPWKNFYSEVQQKNLDEKDATPKRYHNTTMKGIRAGINRYTKEKCNIDIISDKRFIRCNELFQGVLKENTAAGFGNVTHNDPISSEDLERSRSGKFDKNAKEYISGKFMLNVK